MWRSVSRLAVAAPRVLPRVALRAALCVPRAHLSAVAAEGGSTTAATGGGGGTGNMAALVARITEQLTTGYEEMKRVYGADMTEVAWQSDFYRHNQHKYTLPLIKSVMDAAAAEGRPFIAAKYTVLFALVLQTLPPEIQAVYANAVAVLPNPQQLLPALHYANTTASKDSLKRLGVSLLRASSDMEEQVRAVLSVPVVPVDEWTLPACDPKFEKEWKSTTYPFEVAYYVTKAKDVLTAQQFSSLATATIVECLWVAFYVTGDRRYIRRLVQLTAMWKQVAHLSPDMGGVPPPLEAQLPASIENASLEVSGQAKAARLAFWTLVSHARRHPAILATVGEELGTLGEFLLPADLQNPAIVAKATPAEARARLEMCTLLALTIADVAGSAAGALPSPPSSA